MDSPSHRSSGKDDADRRAALERLPSPSPSSSLPPPSLPPSPSPLSASTSPASSPALPPPHRSEQPPESLENGHTSQSLSPFAPADDYEQPVSGDDDADEDLDDDGGASPSRKKHKPLSSFGVAIPPPPPSALAAKKPKKKSTNVWTKPTSRKGKKKPKPVLHVAPEDKVLMTPIPRFPDKSDDNPEVHISLSRVYKAEKVELSEDRLSAGSTKGYRMVRATRGVNEGAWYLEIRVMQLGHTGHTRLGWTTDKGDLQAPVGYDGNSYGYRDVGGCKIHKALREKYGQEGYGEGDVIGCYINLPNGALYAPKPPHLIWFKGQTYVCPADGKDEPPKVVPGSEITFFKNGVCQGIAFTDLFGGRYYPAASMYTLPNQPNCEVRFNFGPDFQHFPPDLDGRPMPRPMIEVPYHGYDYKIVGPTENGSAPEKTS